MANFITNNFILENDAAAELYHSHAAEMPIIDYHCHLDPSQIACDHRFESIGEMWLSGDHYKWRTMRACGISEEYITGNASFREKFMKWAEVVPYTMRNPLYHWTHLELKRVFEIDDILNPKSAAMIYDRCAEMLKGSEFSSRSIIKKFNVELICTTDDPLSSLHDHKKIKNDGFATKVLPTWRPDKAMMIEQPGYFDYIAQLSDVSGVDIHDAETLLEALGKRHDYFAENGCILSDHGITKFPNANYDKSELTRIFEKARKGEIVNSTECDTFRFGILIELAKMNADKNWVQQFHIGANRNNNTKMFKRLGADSGFDAIDNTTNASALHRFFDTLDSQDKLSKTILYSLNPCDNEVLIATTGTFNDSSAKGKMQFGSAWWFLDNEEGMTKQINTLSSLGLLSTFVGMLTDSRSFLSYPRHEYFRRILCNIIGKDIESGRLPKSEMEFIGKITKDICYNNAKHFFI